MTSYFHSMNHVEACQYRCSDALQRLAQANVPAAWCWLQGMPTLEPVMHCCLVYVECESEAFYTPQLFWKYSMWLRILTKILHAYCTFTFMLNYQILFSYLYLWQIYAILSVIVHTTQHTRWSSLPGDCCSSVECSFIVCSFCAIASAVPPRPEYGTVSVIVLFTIVSSCVTDCNF